MKNGKMVFVVVLFGPVIIDLLFMMMFGGKMSMGMAMFRVNSYLKILPIYLAYVAVVCLVLYIYTQASKKQTKEE